jgi:hypothetical protein
VPSEQLELGCLDGSPIGGRVLDRDVHTVWSSRRSLSRGSGIWVRLAVPRRVSALVLVVDLDRSPLHVAWICDIDGELAARGPGRYGLQWVAGVPRAGKQALLSIPLASREASRIRLIFQAAGPPLALSEVFVYGPDEPAREPRGRGLAAAALDRARHGDWEAAARLYSQACDLEPHRASLHAALLRVRWRASRRRWLDVESLDDGGRQLVGVR